MKLKFLSAILGLAAVLPAQQDVRSTLHNLSRSGPGKITSATSDDVCGFCHVPHTASPEVPLWGHKLSDAAYRLYASETLDGFVPQPNGSSKLCLSCHDGTIALGELAHRQVDLGVMSSSARGFVGTDLSGSHPVSMTVDEGLVQRNNRKDTPLRSLPEMRTDPDGVRLDAADRLQCTTCHEPHRDMNHAPSGVHFWRKPTIAEVCTTCHTY